MNYQLQLTILSFNSLSMFFCNNTQAFMAAKFTEEEDYHYIHKLTWEANGEEKKWHKERKAHDVDGKLTLNHPLIISVCYF